MALEPEFWVVLARMAQARGQTLAALVATADAARGVARPLASALRVMALLSNTSLTEPAGIEQDGVEDGPIGDAGADSPDVGKE